MYELIHDSGPFGWLSVLLTITAIAAVTTIGRRWRRPGSVAAAWAVAILASGAAGFGLGQRRVHVVVTNPRQPPSLLANMSTDERVRLLSHGTAEAAANYVLAGGGALIVSLLGGSLVLFRRREDAAPAKAV